MWSCACAAALAADRGAARHCQSFDQKSHTPDWPAPPQAGRYLWRAVDAEGEILDVLVQSKRNKHAALKLMRKLLKKYGFVPGRLVTYDLRSYGAAARDLGIEGHHERGRWKNNRAENSHQPARRRERKMQGFKSQGSANDSSQPMQPSTIPSTSNVT
jgi:transposase-like protein